MEKRQHFANMSATETQPPKPQEQITAQIVGVAVLVYTLGPGERKPVCRYAPLTQPQQDRLLGFITHKLHGGRLQLSNVPEQKRIITP